MYVGVCDVGTVSVVHNPFVTLRSEVLFVARTIVGGSPNLLVVPDKHEWQRSLADGGCVGSKAAGLAK